MRKFPDFPEAPHNATPEQLQVYDTLREWWGQTKLILHDLDSKAIQGAAGKSPWVINNVSVVHKLDVTSATDLYTANRLGVLLQDLKNKGIIS